MLINTQNWSGIYSSSAEKNGCTAWQRSDVELSAQSLRGPPSCLSDIFLQPSMKRTKWENKIWFWHSLISSMMFLILNRSGGWGRKTGLTVPAPDCCSSALMLYCSILKIVCNSCAMSPSVIFAKVSVFKSSWLINSLQMQSCRRTKRCQVINDWESSQSQVINVIKFQPSFIASVLQSGFYYRRFNLCTLSQDMPGCIWCNYSGLYTEKTLMRYTLTCHFIRNTWTFVQLANHVAVVQCIKLCRYSLRSSVSVHQKGKNIWMIFGLWFMVSDKDIFIFN